MKVLPVLLEFLIFEIWSECQVLREFLILYTIQLGEYFFIKIMYDYEEKYCKISLQLLYNLDVVQTFKENWKSFVFALLLSLRLLKNHLWYWNLLKKCMSVDVSWNFMCILFFIHNITSMYKYMYCTSVQVHVQ